MILTEIFSSVFWITIFKKPKCRLAYRTIKSFRCGYQQSKPLSWGSLCEPGVWYGDFSIILCIRAESFVATFSYWISTLHLQIDNNYSNDNAIYLIHMKIVRSAVIFSRETSQYAPEIKPRTSSFDRTSSLRLNSKSRQVTFAHELTAGGFPPEYSSNALCNKITIL